MAKRKSLLDLLAKLEPGVQKAFLQSVQGIKNDVVLADLVDALARRDLDAAVAILTKGAEYFAPLDRAIEAAYLQGGEWTFDELKALAKKQGSKVIARFDGRNPRAETWLRAESSTLVTRINDGQREAIRSVLRDGMVAGSNPRTTALDVVGRVSRATGRREGGIVGLTDQQMKWSQSALAELRSGDEAKMMRYFDRRARDRRFDRTVMRAIREGKPLDAETSRKIIGRYQDRLLKLRGDTIARTETLAALHESQNEGVRQMIDKGRLDEESVTRIWDSSGNDGRTRDNHLAMEGDEAGVGDVFTSPSGAMMKYPGDTSLGAPGSETINCRCHVRLKIDHFKDLE